MQRLFECGLNEQQVLRNRKVYGSNVVSATKPLSWKQRLSDTFRHPFTISLMTIIAVSFVVALKLNGEEQIGQRVFMMPIVFIISLLISLGIGFLNGFKNRRLFILLLTAICELAISTYVYIFSDVSVGVFGGDFGFQLFVLLSAFLSDFILRYKNKRFQKITRIDDNSSVITIRNNHVVIIPRKELVVGDIVILHKNDTVPADCEIINELNLSISSSSFIQESNSHSISENYENRETIKTDSEQSKVKSVLFCGTHLVEGQCVARVVHVGDNIKYAKSADDVSFDESDNVLLRAYMKKVLASLNIIGYSFAILFVIVRFILLYDESCFNPPYVGFIGFLWYATQTMCVTILILMITNPEFITSVIQLVVAFNVDHMQESGFIPLSVDSCLKLAEADALWLENTDFFSTNHFKVAHISISNVSQERLAEMISTNTTAYLSEIVDVTDKMLEKGNSIETAMLKWLIEQGADVKDIRNKTIFVDRIEPKGIENGLATIIKSSEILGKNILYVKGNPFSIMNLTDMSLAEINDVKNQLHNCWRKGWQTVAFAYGILNENENPFDNGSLNIHNLNFAGFMAFETLFQENVIPVLDKFSNLGIDVNVVLTSNLDPQKSLLEINHVVSQSSSAYSSVSSSEIFNEHNDSDSLIKHCGVKLYSLNSPVEMSDIPDPLKKDGKVVASCNVSSKLSDRLDPDVSIITSRDASSPLKVSSILLRSPSLMSIYSALEWGRSMVDYIRRYLMFLFFSSCLICVTILLGLLVSHHLPFSESILILFYISINIVATTAISSIYQTNSKKTIVRKKSMSLFSGNMYFHIVFSSLVAFTVICLFSIGFQHRDVHSLYYLFSVNLPHQRGLNAYECTLLSAIVFSSLFWYLWNVKTYSKLDFVSHGLRNSITYLKISLSYLLIMTIVLISGGFLFSLDNIRFFDWIVLFVFTSMLLWMNKIPSVFSLNMNSLRYDWIKQIKMLPEKLPKLKKSCISLWQFTIHSLVNAGKSILKLFKWIIKNMARLLIKLIEFIQNLSK